MLLAAAVLLAQSGELAAKSQRARRAMEAGRFEEAAFLYQELVREVPGNAGLLLNLGLALHSAGRHRPAIEQFQAALKQQPELAPALLMLGVAHLKLGEPDRALEPLKRAVKVAPSNRLALFELADTQLALGRVSEAAASFRRLTELDPGNPRAWQGLGMSCLSLSRRTFDRLEKTAPRSAWWYALLARSKLEQQQYRTAFYLYKQALALAPDLPGIHAALAEIYRQTGHPEWAGVEEERARALAPRKSAPREGTPEFLHDEALRYSRQALEAFARLAQMPPTAEIHELMAESFRLQGNHARAVEEWRAALKLRPGDHGVEKELATALWLARDYESALPLLDRLHASEPGSARLNQLLGDCLLERGQLEKAIPYLETAVKVEPGLLRAHASLGRALLYAGRPTEAIAHLKTALPVDEDGSLYFQLSQALRRAGQDEAARRAHEEFIRISQDKREHSAQLERERQITPP
jgi:tetratricopeptide (TPR) repeat protein